MAKDRTDDLIEKSGNGKTILYWGLGGMLGGLVVGITLVRIYGWTLLNAGFWIGFGLIVGAISGLVSYVLYRAIHGLVLKIKQAE